MFVSILFVLNIHVYMIIKIIVIIHAVIIFPVKKSYRPILARSHPILGKTGKD